MEDGEYVTDQPDLFARYGGRDCVVENELWRRRQNRREARLTASLSKNDAMLVPLALALARLAAQRDARTVMAGNQPITEAQA